MRRLVFALGVMALAAAGGVMCGAKEITGGQLVKMGADGKLAYDKYDPAGDTIPDFSNAGYMGGGWRFRR